MMKLDNKIALITRSASGMGQTMAGECAGAGATVALPSTLTRSAPMRGVEWKRPTSCG